MACGRSLDLPRILALRGGFPTVARDAALTGSHSPPIPGPSVIVNFLEALLAEAGHNVPTLLQMSGVMFGSTPRSALP